MKFKSDFSVLKNFYADILFIQECEKVPRNHFPGFDFHWIGQNEKKGLGVLTKGDSKFPQDIYSSKFVYFLPVVFQETLILGTWSFNGRAKKFDEGLSGYFLEVLEHYGDWIKSSKQVVIAGDFNNGPQWDVAGHPNNFADINIALNNLGLKSAYHSYFSEEHGQETRQTHFHQRNPDKPFHIDYIYSNFKKVDSVEVGKFLEWSHLSDHVPMTAVLSN
jgi:endonuclease/exonuclease/phosphatase family metal-dependent hydrolase